MSSVATKTQPGIKPKSYIVDKMKDFLDKDLVILDHGCYICGRVFSSAAAARGHVKSIHRYNIPGRSNGVKRPLHRNYNYSTRTDTDEYDGLHYACPSCWFHCPLDRLDELHDHTMEQHNPSLHIPKSEGKYDADVDSGSENPASVPHSLQNSRRSSRQSNFSISSCLLGYTSNNDDNDEENAPLRRPSIRKVRISEDHKNVPSISDDKKSELSQKIDELRGLFRALFA
ncbi:hypothetical protein MFLAVUS_010745 [Mucor flavus]|uniref:C2H2-type domain-containing protein n=1 Tax=Mucor flavus TaxID=439312 RepID=A0ABP9ZDL8_9FUNG